jgi:hypothetical protein
MDAIARDAWLIADDGAALARDAIEERRFAYVWATDDNNCG